METGAVKVDVETQMFSQTLAPPLSLNTVCINLFHKFQKFVIDNIEGRVTCTGLYPAPPLRVPRIVLNLFNYEFTLIHLFPVINSRLHDPPLSHHIAKIIADEAIKSVGVVQPLFMSVKVVLRQEVFSMISEEEEEKPICSICLENLRDGDDNDDQEIQKLPHCSHQFHRECIVEWLMRCNSCPLCRRSVL